MLKLNNLVKVWNFFPGKDGETLKTSGKTMSIRVQKSNKQEDGTYKEDFNSIVRFFGKFARINGEGQEDANGEYWYIEFYGKDKNSIVVKKGDTIKVLDMGIDSYSSENTKNGQSLIICDASLREEDVNDGRPLPTSITIFSGTENGAIDENIEDEISSELPFD